MKYLLQALCVAATLAASSAASAAGITLYRGEEFRGRDFATSDAVPNLENFGFNDRASSVIVNSGRWELCSDANFRGRCVTLEPGEYPSLASMGMENQVSSLRLAGGGPPPQIVGAMPPRAAQPPVPGGPPPHIAGAMPPMGAQPSAPGGPRPEQWGERARVVLYENPGMQGRSMVIANDYIGDLGRGGFNDRTQSLRVESGYWIFCTDAFFKGTCRTFGPGDYVSLPPELDNRISSGRKIADAYPYSGRADWTHRR